MAGKQLQTSEAIPSDLRLFGEHDLVAMGLAKSVHTLRTWRFQGRGPKYVKCGRLVKYRLSDLQQFLNAVPTGGGNLGVRA